MTKTEFILDWADKEDRLTSYNMNPKVLKWIDTFYPVVGHDPSQERRAISNLTLHFRKLIKENVLSEPFCLGAGPDSRNLFFGTTRQYFWNVNKHKLSLIKRS